jgi:hypothetical protein
MSDLLKLQWNHIGEDAIEIRTGKSRGKEAAYVPLSDDLRKIIEGIPKVGATVLTNSLKKRWTANGFGSSSTPRRTGVKLNAPAYLNN